VRPSAGLTYEPHPPNTAAHTEAAKHVEEKRRFFVVLIAVYTLMVKGRLSSH
jgi:hypothetical protein